MVFVRVLWLLPLLHFCCTLDLYSIQFLFKINHFAFFVFFYSHIPKAKATAIADTPELKRIAENTKIQSNVKYHADFEKQKGKLTQVWNFGFNSIIVYTYSIQIMSYDFANCLGIR